MQRLIPKYMFLTKGVGFHKDKLNSFENALRDAGIEKFNLVTVSSILPPSCRVVTKKKGLELLLPGEIVFCVLSRIESNEPSRQISAANGLAVPADKKNAYGYISEHHEFGQSASAAGDYAEDLAAQMLGATLGITVDPSKAWDERKQVYLASGRIFETRHVAKGCQVPKDGRWATVVTATVFIV